MEYRTTKEVLRLTQNEVLKLRRKTITGALTCPRKGTPFFFRIKYVKICSFNYLGRGSFVSKTNTLTKDVPFSEQWQKAPGWST